MAERPRELPVLYRGLQVATLRERRRRIGIDCVYTPEALERWPGNTPLLSCSLPLGPGKLDATAFLEGLLPEGVARALIAADRGVAATDIWMLLAHLGRDVAGALSLTPADETSLQRPATVHPYLAADLEAAVANLPRSPLDLHDDSELSLAGIQNKMTLVALSDGGWGRPVGGTTSTHILKAEDRRFPGLVTLEQGGLRLARHLGLTDIDAEVVRLGTIDCLVVSRFGRVVQAGAVERVHQEDLCQACGYNPSIRRKGKYERHDGPGFLAAVAFLRQWGRPGQREQLLRAMTFTVVIGNADAHAKNLGLLHPEPGVIELAPLYDTVPTVLFDSLPRGPAMTINSVFADIEAVTFGDLVAEVAGRRRWGLNQAGAVEIVADTLQRAVDGLDQLALPDQLADYVDRRGRLRLAQQP